MYNNTFINMSYMLLTNKSSQSSPEPPAVLSPSRVCVCVGVCGLTPYAISVVTPSGAVGLESSAKHGFGCICLCALLHSLKLPTVYFLLLTCVAKDYLSCAGSTNRSEHTNTHERLVLLCCQGCL